MFKGAVLFSCSCLLWWKENPSSHQPPPLKVTRTVNVKIYCLWRGGIKICRALLLNPLSSAGFLDHRAVLLAVMGPTKIAANFICNRSLFSMHLRPAYPFGLSRLPPGPLLCGWTLLPSPFAPSLPLHTQGWCQGTERWSSWGQGTMLFLSVMTPRYVFKNHALQFSWVSEVNILHYWL